MGIRLKEQLFKKLFSENYSRLYSIAYYLIKDSEAAKDLVNDVFANLWESFDPDTKEYTHAFLYKNIYNKCIDYTRHSDVENRYLALYMNIAEKQSPDWEEQDERLEVIYKVMEEMPPRTRFVVEQCYFNNKKYAEVADILNISTDGVRKHIMKALGMIRKEFSVNYKKGQYPKEK